MDTGLDIKWNKVSCTIRVEDERLFDDLHRKINELYGPGVSSAKGTIYKSSGVGMATITLYDTTTTIHVQGHGYSYWVQNTLSTLIPSSQTSSDTPELTVSNDLPTAADLPTSADRQEDQVPSVDSPPSPSRHVHVLSAESTVFIPTTVSQIQVDNIQLRTENNLLREFLKNAQSENARLHERLLESERKVENLMNKIQDIEPLEFETFCDKKLILALEQENQRLVSSIPSSTVDATSIPACISVVSSPPRPNVDATSIPADVVTIPTRNSFSCLRVEEPEANDEVNDGGVNDNGVNDDKVNDDKVNDGGINGGGDNVSGVNGGGVNDGGWKVVAKKSQKKTKKMAVDKDMKRDTTIRRDKNIVIIGDSLVKRMDKQCDAEGNVVRVCLPGCRVEHVTERIDNIMHGEGDDPIVIVHVGTNNINKCTSGKLMIKYKALIEKLYVKCPKAKLIISGILDRRDKWFGNRIYEANQALQLLCKQKGVDFLNHDFLRHREGWLASDKLHLSPRGNAILGDAFRKAIRSALNA